MNLADGFDVVRDAARRGALPDPELHVDEWSEEFMVLPRDAAEPGPYRLERTPPARRILQVLSPRHPCKRVVIRGASQMLKTQVMINWLMASAHRAAANALVLEPTDSLAKRLSARITKTIRDVPVLQTVFAPARSRDARNTVAAKDFVGGTLYIATAGAAANLAEIPARYVGIDEVDRLETSVDGEGDPVEIAEARATTFNRNCKFLEVSSPTLRGTSKIDALYEMGTQEVYLVPCPHCAHHQELVLERFHYARDPDTGFMTRAWFVCPACGAEIDERYKGRMLRDASLGGTAHWFAKSVGDGETISFHISAFYAQPGSITWLQLARQLARAKERDERGDPDALQVFFNTRLALSYSDTRETSTWQELQLRQLEERLPARVIPSEALVVTISVDTQPNRLEVQAEAWGPGMERWVIDHQVFMGSPTAMPDEPGSVWARLDAYRREPFTHASGVMIPASVYGIDSGGANTQDVYNYGAARVHHGCLIFKGASRPNRPIISSTPTKVDIDHAGGKIEGGALLWLIGTDVAKDYLHGRWKLHHGAGAIHFNVALSQDWFEQVMSESLRLRRLPTGGHRRVWDKIDQGARNEALDLTVYNLALAHYLGLHKWPQQQWDALRKKLIPAVVTPDLFAAPLALPEPAPANPETNAAAGETKPPASKTPPPVPETPPQPAVHTPALPAPGRRRILNRGI
ncbi:phage terminase large subunit family protein [Methylibium sp.]|uniref:phage terminase large subunit family protein n=1 Tax=Methylibium sp. TaxID=2067992 RepID=UPI003D13BDA3